jgi:hypothetical protein
MLEGVALDCVMCSLQTATQSGLRIAIEVVIIDVAYGLNGKPAGFLPAFVSTHAVGDDREAALAVKFVLSLGFPIKIGVLVIVALQTYVRQAGGFNSWLRIRDINRHRRRVSCGLRNSEVESR